mmetsp:Transcript_38395/g.123122  ORF Transcript_38395/g.123122 Transcript_38395/m.123122 type:complete len:396 (+) Transcript_38395:351-1538(+)
MALRVARVPLAAAGVEEEPRIADVRGEDRGDIKNPVLGPIDHDVLVLQRIPRELGQVRLRSAAPRDGRRHLLVVRELTLGPVVHRRLQFAGVHAEDAAHFQTSADQIVLLRFVVHGEKRKLLPPRRRRRLHSRLLGHGRQSPEHQSTQRHLHAPTLRPTPLPSRRHPLLVEQIQRRLLGRRRRRRRGRLLLLRGLLLRRFVRRLVLRRFVGSLLRRFRRCLRFFRRLDIVLLVVLRARLVLPLLLVDGLRGVVVALRRRCRLWCRLVLGVNGGHCAVGREGTFKDVEVAREVGEGAPRLAGAEEEAEGVAEGLVGRVLKGLVPAGLGLLPLGLDDGFGDEGHVDGALEGREGLLDEVIHRLDLVGVHLDRGRRGAARPPRREAEDVLVVGVVVGL